VSAQNFNFAFKFSQNGGLLLGAKFCILDENFLTSRFSENFCDSPKFGQGNSCTPLVSRHQCRHLCFCDTNTTVQV